MGGRNELIGHAFISYVREDSRRVDRLQRMLEAAGILVWRDTADMWPGENWSTKIRHAITDNALVFVACFSQASLSRTRSYQNEELLLAIEQLRLRSPDDPWFIPVRFDECDIPDRDIGAGRTLASIQRVDLFGDHFDEGATRLIAAVLKILGRDHYAAADWPKPEVETLIEHASESRIGYPKAVSVAARATAEHRNVPEAALQARMVYAWCGGIQSTSGDERHSVTVIVQNSSDDPIYGLRVGVGTGWSRDDISYALLMDQGLVIPPRYRQQHTVLVRLDPLPGGGYEDSPPVEMIFGDVAGRFWRRDRYGGLAQIQEVTLSSASNSLFAKPLGKKNVLAAAQRFQAQLVTAWCGGIQSTSGDERHSVTVTVQNSSDDLVHGLSVAVGAQWSRIAVPYVKLDLGLVIPPRYRQQHTVLVRLDPLPGGGYEDSPPVEMIFGDVAGIFWCRDRYGTLAQIQEVTLSSASKHLFEELRP